MKYYQIIETGKIILTDNITMHCDEYGYTPEGPYVIKYHSNMQVYVKSNIALISIYTLHL